MTAKGGDGVSFVMIGTLTVILSLVAVPQQDLSAARELLRQQRYDTAVSRLEEFLETSPGHPEALSLMGVAYLYRPPRDFLKAKSLFEESFRAGGGATFWVHHSHEKLGDEFLADYCRGWLYLDKSGVRFTSAVPEHSFQLQYSGVKEFKQNRWGRRSLFHIKQASRNFNFRPRTGDEREVWLIVAMYKKFSGGDT
jgi:hypothetical protein